MYAMLERIKTTYYVLRVIGVLVTLWLLRLDPPDECPERYHPKNPRI